MLFAVAVALGAIGALAGAPSIQANHVLTGGTLTTGADPQTLAGAIDDHGIMTGAGWHGPPPQTFQRALATADSDLLFPGFPVEGDSFMVLSTGNARDVDHGGEFLDAAHSVPAPAARGNSLWDVAVLAVEVEVPPAHNCLSFNFRFLSMEYPFWQGSQFNDAFVAELDTTTWRNPSSNPAQANISAPDNFARDLQGNPITINQAGMSAANGQGTAFDGTVTADSIDDQSGATARLRALVRADPGAHTLYLSILDAGDDRYDSAVFVDNLETHFVPEGDAACGGQARPDPIAIGDSLQVLEDSGGGPDNLVDVLANDIFTPDAADTLEVRVEDPPGFASVQREGDALRYTPLGDFCGDDPFEYRVTETGSGDWDTATVAVNVVCVNDAPTLTPSADVSWALDDGPYDQVWATDLGPGGGIDEAAQELTIHFDAVDVPDGLYASGPTLDQDGRLSFTADACGTSRHEVWLQDDGGTDDDGEDRTPAHPLNITVVCINDPPTFTPGGDVSVLEDSGVYAQAWATQIDTGAEDGAQTLTFHVTNNTSGLFATGPSIDADGILRFTPAKDQCGTSTIEVYLQDDGGTAGGGGDTSETVSFRLEVACVNDAPSMETAGDITHGFDSGPYDAPWITATAAGGGPDEAGQTVTFFVNAAGGDIAFDAGPTLHADGRVTFTPAQHACGQFEAQAFPRDDGATHDGGIDVGEPHTLRIVIGCVNQPPSFTPGDPVSVLEDAGDVALAWATAIDAGAPHESGQELTFTLTPDDPALFETGPTMDADGTLRFRPAQDASGQTDIAVMLCDDGGTEGGGDDCGAPVGFELTVRPVNDPPSFAYPATVVVHEDSGAYDRPWADGIAVGPPDEATQAASFHLTPADVSLFAVAPALDPDGSLSFTPAPDACGAFTTPLVLVDDGGTDDGGLDTSAEATLHIEIACVNDAPSFAAGPTIRVDEDSGPYTQPWATAIDPGPDNEASQGGTFLLGAVLSGDPSVLVAPPTLDDAGAVSFTPAPDAVGSVCHAVRYQDDGGTQRDGADTSQAETLCITVQEIDDAPSFVPGGDMESLEDAGTRVVAWATGIDRGGGPDEQGQRIWWEVDVAAPPGLFSMGPTLDGSGILRYQAAPHQNGQATLRVTLVDDGDGERGTNRSDEHTFSILVHAVNDAPTFTPGPDLSLPEDTGPTHMAWASDVATGPAEEPQTQQPTFDVIIRPEDAWLFASPPTLGADGGLSFTPAQDAAGTARLTVVLRDDGGRTHGGSDTSTAHLLTIVLRPVNDPPALEYVPVLEAWEDEGPYALPVASSLGPGGGADEQGQTVTFVATGHDPSLLVSPPFVDAEGRLRFETHPHAFGSITLKIQAKDDGGTEDGGQDISPPRAVLLRIHPVNDPPGFTQGPSFAFTAPADPPLEQAPWARDIRRGPANEHGQGVRFETTVADPGLFEQVPFIDAAGRISYELASGAYGSTTMDVCLHDDGGTARGGDDFGGCVEVPWIIRSINDPPTFTGGGDIIVPEDGRYDAIWATDMDAGGADEAWQVLRFLIIGDRSLFLSGPTLDAQGRLSFVPRPDVHGEADLMVYLLDDGGTELGGDPESAPVQLRIKIDARPDPPIAIPDSYTVLEDGHLSVAAPGVMQNDMDADGDALSVALTQGPMHGTLSLDADGSLRYTPEPDWYGTDHATYRLHDGIHSTEATISLHITPTDDPPVGVPDYYALRPGVPLQVLPTHGTLHNDLDRDHVGLTAILERMPSHGRLDLRPDGGFRYVPDAGFQGTDHFVYRASDGGAVTSQATKVHLRIQGNAPPVADFTVRLAAAGEALTFRDASRDPDGAAVGPDDGQVEPAPVEAWLWDFGDGTTSTQQHPVHAYALPGTYTVRLKVTDREGTSGQTTRELTIEDGLLRGAPPRIAAGPNQTVHPGQTVVLTVQVLSGDPVVQWRQTQGPPVVLDGPVFTAPSLHGIEAHLAFEGVAVGGGVTSRPVTAHVTIVPSPQGPRILLGGDQIVPPGASVAVQALLIGVEGTPTWHQVAGPPLGLGEARGGHLSFNMPEVPGATVTLRASIPDAAVPPAQVRIHAIPDEPPTHLAATVNGTSLAIDARGTLIAVEIDGIRVDPEGPWSLTPGRHDIVAYTIIDDQAQASHAQVVAGVSEQVQWAPPTDAPATQTRRVVGFVALGTVLLAAAGLVSQRLRP